MVRKHTGNPVGAPPKGPYSNKKAAITARIEEGLKAKLIEATKVSGFSLNQEIEVRLNHSFSSHNLDKSDFGSPQILSVSRLLGMMMRNFQAFEGEELWNGEEAHEELKDAILTVLNAFGPQGGIPEPSKGETAGQRRGRNWITQFRNAGNIAPRMKAGKLNKQNEGAYYMGDDFTHDEYAFREIWIGLGSLANKLENDNE